MSIYKGKNLKIEITGESHSKTLKGSIKGLSKFKIDYEKLNLFLERRKANNEIYSTSRIEEDRPIFFGVKNNIIKNKVSFIIENRNVNEKDYSYLYGIPRPSHADYAWHLKDGVLDFSGGGRFSGRMTLPLCVIGGICLQYLGTLNVKICSYIESVGSVKG
ncbi:MAG: chorismate synthase, partial [Firmicutes bacterium]|nr:chorismate synthase [Candidatus Caballimonas caccae]